MPALTQQSIMDVLQGWVETFIVPFIFGIISVSIGYFICRYVVSVIKRKIRKNNETIEGEDPYAKKIADMIGSMVFYILMIFNILISFQVVGLDVAILMAGVSFGIGFAMQTLLTNMVSGIMIITNPKIRTGETIQILGSLNVFGVIESLSARNCVIKLFTGRKLIVPNKLLVGTPIKTFKTEPFIVQTIIVSVDLQSDIAGVKTILTNIINGFAGVIHPETTLANVETITEAGINMTVYFHTDPQHPVKGGILRMKSLMRIAIQKTFKAHNISMPYPHQVLNIE